MPISLESPVLVVDTKVIHKVDTSNPDNLYSMWTVFAKCADSVPQGRRLENLSWRLWNRETFCFDRPEQQQQQQESALFSSTSTLPRDIQPSQRSSLSEDLPRLSGSVESLEEEAVEFVTDSDPVDIIRPRITRQDSSAGRERHITSSSLEKMVLHIIEAKEPLDAPLPDIAASFPPKVPSPLESDGPSGSTTADESSQSSDSSSAESLEAPSSPEITLHVSAPESPASQRNTTVVRGFSPSQAAFSRITSQQPASQSTAHIIPEPTDAPASKTVQPKKKLATFALGGSSGSGDDSYSDRGQSLETRKQPVPQPPKKKVFQIGGSSEEENSLKSAMHSSRSNMLGLPKKTASFNSQAVTQTYPAASAVSDNEQSETDYVDESAIDDDDDSSDWEDSVEDSGKSSLEEKINFQRVDSKANLASRRSLITLMLNQNQNAQKAGSIASHSTSALPRTRTPYNGPTLVASPNDSDEAPLMMRRATRAPPLRPITEIPRSTAQPILTTTNGMPDQAALSPRTTRRNMLATELPESLRRHLLWERQQKSSTANAVLKRRHTSHDVANLKQYPEKPYMKDNDANANSSDHYFSAFNGYHAEGW